MSTSWRLIYVTDGHRFHESLFNKLKEHCPNIKFENFDIVRPNRVIGPCGTQGCAGATGPIGDQTYIDAQGFKCSRSVFGPEPPKPKTCAEIQNAMSVQSIINEIGKGFESDPKYFHPYEDSNTCNFFILVKGEGDLKTTAFEIAGIYYPRTVSNNYTNRTSYCKDVCYTVNYHNLRGGIETVFIPQELVRNVSVSTKGPATLHHLFGWMCKLAHPDLDMSWLPPLEITVQNFNTYEDYLKHQQAEHQKKIDAEKEWKRKYRVDTGLYIAPDVCDKTGIKTTCVILEDSDSEDDCEYCNIKKRYTVSLEYLNHKAKQMQP